MHFLHLTPSHPPASQSDPNVNIRQVQMLNVLSERHTEASDETLVAQTNKSKSDFRLPNSIA